MNQKQAFERAQRQSAEDKMEIVVFWNGRSYVVIPEWEFQGDDNQIIAKFAKGYRVQ